MIEFYWNVTITSYEYKHIKEQTALAGKPDSKSKGANLIGER